jgi:hypothetical protein
LDKHKNTPPTEILKSAGALEILHKSCDRVHPGPLNFHETDSTSKIQEGYYTLSVTRTVLEQRGRIGVHESAPLINNNEPSSKP